MKGRGHKRPRSGRGALLVIGSLFLISGLIRLADGTGAAIAREVESLTDAGSETSESKHQQTVEQECITEDGFNEVMVRLRQRRDELDARETEITQRMAKLKEAETLLRANLEAVEKAEQALSATIARADGAAEQDIEALIAVYEKMKPKDASVVFEAMDSSFAAGFLARMRPESAASVMAGMSAEKAYTVSILLAGRNMNVPKN